MAERALIAAVRRAAGPGGGPVRLGIGDDCAILRPRSGHEIVVTTDLFLEQVHFRRDWHTPEVAGHRCLARGLSDLAAMGAAPIAAFLSMALPPELAGDWVKRFLAGLLRLARAHGVPLAGGDTAPAPGRPPGRRSPNAQHVGQALFAADIVLVGSVPRGKALLRSAAHPGDAVYVTGSLGGAAAELALLAAAPEKFARRVRASAGHPHLFPQPRLAVGAWLSRRSGRRLGAAIDLSDGLSTDLTHLCEESGVTAELDAAVIPLHPLAARAPRALELALHGGEDYELLFTAPPNRRIPGVIKGVPVHRIGTIRPPAGGRPRVALIDAQGKRTALRSAGWEHLRT